MTYIPYLETFFSRGTPVWPWPVINAEAGWWTPLNVFFFRIQRRVPKI